ncbi:13711_t:CDS:1, partial [Ambispora leptoticha]
SEQQERLQQNQQKLEKLKGVVEGDKLNTQNSEQNNSNDNFPKSLILGGTILLAIGGLLT